MHILLSLQPDSRLSKFGRIGFRHTSLIWSCKSVGVPSGLLVLVTKGPHCSGAPGGGPWSGCSGGKLAYDSGSSVSVIISFCDKFDPRGCCGCTSLELFANNPWIEVIGNDQNTPSIIFSVEFIHILISESTTGDSSPVAFDGPPSLEGCDKSMICAFNWFISLCISDFSSFLPETELLDYHTLLSTLA